MKSISFLIFFLVAAICRGQHIAESFGEAEKNGISINHFDSVYKSAGGNDTSKVVFKTPAEQEKLISAYTGFLQDLGNFLQKNNFKWGHRSRCFNRIYFAKDGSVDYFLYSFNNKSVKPEEKVSEEKEAEFKKLLNLFIQTHRIDITAKVKFAQCSPVTYVDKE